MGIVYYTLHIHLKVDDSYAGTLASWAWMYFRIGNFILTWSEGRREESYHYTKAQQYICIYDIWNSMLKSKGTFMGP